MGGTPLSRTIQRSAWLGRSPQPAFSFAGEVGERVHAFSAGLRRQSVLGLRGSVARQAPSGIYLVEDSSKTNKLGDTDFAGKFAQSPSESDASLAWGESRRLNNQGIASQNINAG